MIKEIEKMLPIKFKNCEIIKIENGASRRKYYRLKKNEQNAILMDSSKEPKQFKNYLKVHKILSKTKISIPEIYEIDRNKKNILLEDFGELRFDQILNKFELKDLLSIAVESLIEIKKEIGFDHNYLLPIYNYNIFKSEISEFVNFFYPYHEKKKMPIELQEEFYDTWKSQFDLFDFSFTSFVHKDYNFNNLIYLPNKNKHYKCGIIDFQNSFWGEDCWDLFSLLEDSRILIDDQYNEFFIDYFCLKTNQGNVKKVFANKYHFFNSSRQTRILGRWVKLSNMFNQKWYLDFIEITNKRLVRSLQKPYMKKIRSLYYKLIPQLYAF